MHDNDLQPAEEAEKKADKQVEAGDGETAATEAAEAASTAVVKPKAVSDRRRDARREIVRRARKRQKEQFARRAGLDRRSGTVRNTFKIKDAVRIAPNDPPDVVEGKKALKGAYERVRKLSCKLQGFLGPGAKTEQLIGSLLPRAQNYRPTEIKQLIESLKRSENLIRQAIEVARDEIAKTAGPK